MKRIILGLFGAVVLLGACTLQQQANATAQLAALCKAAAPVVSAATTTAPDPTSAAAELLLYAKGTCTADGQIAAALASNVTDATPAWFQNVMSGLALAANVAPMVLAVI